MRRLTLPILGIFLLAGCTASKVSDETAANTDPNPSESLVDATSDDESSSEQLAETEPARPESIESVSSKSEEVDVAPDQLSPKQQYAAIKKKFDDAMSDFQKVYSKAKTRKEKQDAMGSYPQAGDFADEFQDFADAHPDSDEAVDALSWVASRSRGTGAEKALDTLIERYADNPKIALAVSSLTYSRSEKAEKQLRSLLNSASDEVGGMATYTLASMLMRRGEKPEEAEQLMEKVIADYSDLTIGPRNYRIADRADGALFELRNLQIGMDVPEIEGDDLHGEPFKLSDYRGKVVFLDFWGHW